MELRNLQSFLKVAELGNFTNAANQIGYSQAAVTVHIKQLESELGAPLFDRIGNNTTLTPTGVKLVEYANQILNIYANIENLTSPEPALMQGYLRLGAVESVSTSILVPTLIKFHAKYPNINVDIQTGYRKKLFDMLNKNEVDLIFTIGSKDAPEYCVEILNLHEQSSFFAPVCHPLTEKTVHVCDLFDYPFILTGYDSFLERELFRLADSCGKTIRSFIRSSNTNSIIQMVENNLGISFLGISSLQPFVDRNTLSYINLEDYSFFYDICAYRNRSKWLSPQMNGFLETLTETCSL